MTSHSAPISRAHGRPKATPNAHFLPKEHGAYAELLFPIITALVIFPVSPAAILFATAVVCGFLAHEPALVLLGHRGPRMKRERSAAARKHFFWRISATALASAGTLLLADDSMKVTFFVPAIFTLALIIPVLRKKEKTLFGEVLVAGAFASSTYVMTAGHHEGLRAALVWAFTFSLATLAVRGVIAKKWRKTQRTLAIIMSTTMLIAASWQLVGEHFILMPFVPIAVATVGISIWRPKPKYLRRVGWTLVATNFATLALLMMTSS